MLNKVYHSLAELYEKTGDYKKAYKSVVFHSQYKDSLINEAATKKTLETQMQYAFDKKETIAKAEQLRKDSSAKKEKEKQQFILYGVLGGLLLVIIFSVFIYSRFKITKRQKKIIEMKEQEAIKQNELITLQKHIVEEKQIEILGSIRYAKRIQQSLMPTEKYIERIINTHKLKC